ncbi:helix-turn-helix transcriptional regulator [Tateyamaria sp. SN3-11]|uniref:helix-turn-helix transcriptional regulator n=1 Tax=Tateyamaria sp. SN3-11 TaxID=3092147 RepID=UPI0039E7CC8C
MKNCLKVLRADRGWSQTVLGEHLDVSRQTINAIEAGRYDPSLPLAFKIARLFERSIEDIFDDGEDDIRCAETPPRIQKVSRSG